MNDTFIKPISKSKSKVDILPLSFSQANANEKHQDDNITILLESIKKNKSFFNLLNYSLYSLRALTFVLSNNENINNSKLILNSDFLSIVDELIDLNLNEEEIIEKLASIIYSILNNHNNDTSKQGNSIIDIYIEKKGIDIISNLIDILIKNNLLLFYLNTVYYLIKSIEILLLSNSSIKPIWKMIQLIIPIQKINKQDFNLNEILELIAFNKEKSSNMPQTIKLDRKAKQRLSVEDLKRNSKDGKVFEEINNISKDDIIEKILVVIKKVFTKEENIKLFDKQIYNELIYFLINYNKIKIITIIQEILLLVYSSEVKNIIEDNKYELIHICLTKSVTLPKITFVFLSSLINKSETELLKEILRGNTNKLLTIVKEDTKKMSIFKSNICLLLIYMARAANNDILGDDSLDSIIDSIINELKNDINSQTIPFLIELIITQLEMKLDEDSLTYIEMMNISKCIDFLIQKNPLCFQFYINILNICLKKEAKFNLINKTSEINDIMIGLLLSNFNNNENYKNSLMKYVISLRPDLTILNLDKSKKQSLQSQFNVNENPIEMRRQSNEIKKTKMLISNYSSFENIIDFILSINNRPSTITTRNNTISNTDNLISRNSNMEDTRKSIYSSGLSSSDKLMVDLTILIK